MIRPAFLRRLRAVLAVTPEEPVEPEKLRVEIGYDAALYGNGVEFSGRERYDRA